MKEPFEDKITNRIREVMEHYEPDYSPQAWEDFRKRMPVPQSWLKRILLKYRYWLAGFTITGILLVSIKVLSPVAIEKEGIIKTAISQFPTDPESEIIMVTVNSDGKVPLKKCESGIITIPDNETTSIDLPDRLNNPLPADTGKDNQDETVSSTYPHVRMNESLPDPIGNNTHNEAITLANMPARLNKPLPPPIWNNQQNESITSPDLPVLLNDTLHVADEENNPMESETTVIPDNFVKRYPVPDILRIREILYPVRTTQLIPVKLQTEKTFASGSPRSERTKKFRLQLPEFNSLKPESKVYNKFTGPNRIALFFSAEIHHSDSLKTIGIARGFGISIEGPIHSSFVVSAGVTLQSMNFNKTISSVKVPIRNNQQTSDSSRIPQYVDSLKRRSGSYKYLELPVFVSYKLTGSEKSQLWICTGVSLIAFLGQKYTYETRVGSVSTSSAVEVKPWKNIYPLGSLNFSILYRYKLSERLFLQSSIQYKQHLVEMGYNSMKLNRLNMQAGLIYRFGRDN